MSTHLDPDALLRATYGVAEANEQEHLRDCLDCSAAVKEAELRRKTANYLPDLPEAFWRRQQATIVAAVRSGGANRTRRKLAAALATAALLAVGMVTTAVRPATPPPMITAADEALWRDALSTANRVEPRALSPARLLLPQNLQEVR